MSLVMDKYEALEEQQNLKYFSFTFALSQGLGALAVILVAVWMGTYESGGGFSWGNAIEIEKQFHYHPLFMVIGMIFLMGEAILVYRVFRHERKKITKLLHAVLHAFTFVFAVTGLQAVFNAHNMNNSANMYSLHSWAGILTVLMFAFQLVFGFVCYMVPGLSMPVREWYMPIHRFFGLAMFGMACACAVMGISERGAFHNKENKWAQFSSEGILMNILGLCILGYCFLVVYLVANPRFRRRSLPEEESFQQLTTND